MSVSPRIVPEAELFSVPLPTGAAGSWLITTCPSAWRRPSFETLGPLMLSSVPAFIAPLLASAVLAWTLRTFAAEMAAPLRLVTVPAESSRTSPLRMLPALSSVPLTLRKSMPPAAVEARSVAAAVVFAKVFASIYV